MSAMTATLTIAKRELKGYFDSPIAYVVICLSFFALGIMFFTDVLGQGFWRTDQATLRPMFEYLPAGLSAVIPVITMKLMAEERRSGTLEMLITLPVRDSDVIVGKYFAALGLVLVLVLASLIYPLLMFKTPWDLGAIDMNPVWSGYLGLVLFSAAAVSIGLLVSSLTSSQAIAFFVSFLLLMGLWSMGYLTELGGPEWLGGVFAYVSTQSRMEGFVRGLVDTRDIIYFLSITALCLIISFRALERRKWA